MRNEVNKTIQSETLQCLFYRREGLTKYALKMASGCMIYIPSFMTTVSSIQVRLT
jgi:hypothetical protein